MNPSAALFDAGRLRDDPDAEPPADLYTAVDDLIDLLDDEDALRARAALLRRNGQTGNPGRFTAEYHILAEGDLAASLADGTLNRDRLADLICDPLALLVAHRAWVDGTVPPLRSAPAADTKALLVNESPTTAESVSRLAKFGENDRVIERLRACRAELRDRCGFTDEQADELERELPDAVPTFSGAAPFWKSLAEWVNAFATRVGATPAAPTDAAEWHRLLERAAVRFVLEEQRPDEPPAFQQFRQNALARRPASVHELATVSAGAAGVPDSYLMQLEARVDTRYHHTLAEFQVHA
jgi:hypothetical protein